MPPPNVTGTLHIGHALTLAIQDALVRSARLDGTDTLFVPGTDHAGLGMYAAVMRNPDFRPDLPLAGRLRAWADHHRAGIISELRGLDLACDWEEEQHTLAPGYRAVVERGFAALAAEGLVYRQEKAVPWCPGCRSVVPDIEQVREAENCAVSLVAARLGNRTHVFEVRAVEEVWGAVAVAVPASHPAAGRTARLTALGDRELPVLGADVDAPRLVVPALRGPDLELARRHGLSHDEVLGPDGRSLVPGLTGLTREELRRETVTRLALRSMARSVPVSRCGTCGTELTTRYTRQWYLRLAPLVAPVRAALDRGDLVIGPASVRKEAVHWMATVHDWCISRQIGWGQVIPAAVCDRCPYFSALPEPPRTCPDCAAPLRPETDVFDTWFNSAHWTVAVSGWPDPARTAERYPAAIMTSGRDIVFFWIIRLLAIGHFLTGRLPAPECRLHGMVVDEHGRKMSKSRGNGLSLADALAEHGGDVLRAGLLSACREADNVRARPELFAAQRQVRDTAERLARLVSPPGSGAAPDELEHHCRAAARTARAAIRGHLDARHFDRAVGRLTAFRGQVLARYVDARTRRPSGGGAVTAELLTDVAAVYEPFMPRAAEALRAAARSRPATAWQVDAGRADAVESLLAAVEEAERLKGAIGFPDGTEVVVAAADASVAASSRARAAPVRSARHTDRTGGQTRRPTAPLLRPQPLDDGLRPVRGGSAIPGREFAGQTPGDLRARPRLVDPCLHDREGTTALGRGAGTRRGHGQLPSDQPTQFVHHRAQPLQQAQVIDHPGGRAVSDVVGDVVDRHACRVQVDVRPFQTSRHLLQVSRRRRAVERIDPGLAGSARRSIDSLKLPLGTI